jgi:hypothetical protein
MATKNKAKDKEKNKEIRYLEKLIAYSARCVDGKHEILDSVFTDQIKKLQVQIDKLEEKQ